MLMLVTTLKYEPSREKTNSMVSEQVQHKSGCTVTEDGQRLKKKRKCTICVAKTKALISFAVTAKLICVFVFAYADCWFSHEAAHDCFAVSMKLH